MQATQTPLRQDQALQQNQFAALELALGQLNQLGNLNRQVSQLVALQQQQMAQQQFLAGLQQLLFELDQTARYLQGLRDQDLFAAGLLAHARLDALQRIGVHPGMLPSFEHKRLLADMTTFFQQLWAELQASSSLAALAGQFIDASRKYNTLQARLPYDAKGQLNRLRVQLEEDQRGCKRWDSFRVPLFVVSLLVLLCSGGGRSLSQRAVVQDGCRLGGLLGRRLSDVLCSACSDRAGQPELGEASPGADEGQPRPAHAALL